MAIPKILVCITPQSNSTRLIDNGASLAAAQSGELHILHIERGDSLFQTDNSSKLLQQLFEYGSERGGITHGLCGTNISELIINFILTEQITSVVFGEPPVTPAAVPSVIEKTRIALPQVTFVVLQRGAQ